MHAKSREKGNEGNGWKKNINKSLNIENDVVLLILVMMRKNGNT